MVESDEDLELKVMFLRKWRRIVEDDGSEGGGIGGVGGLEAGRSAR